MGRLSLKNVTERKGLLYFRRKIAGKDTYIRLPAIDDPDFHAEYKRLSEDGAKRQGPAPGSIAALVAAYKANPEFQALELSTRTNQMRYLEMISTEIGERGVKGIRPTHIYTMRDRMAETPGKANAWLSVLRALLAYATRLDMRADNPASGIKRLELGEHEPWPADLLHVALEETTPMTRLAIVTGLCSGQRVSDCIRMQYGWIEGGIMEFAQKKTGKDVAIPMHPFWHEELKKLPRRATTLLYERSGAPFKTTGAIQARLRDLMATKAVREVHADLVAREVIDEDATFSFHGLRKNACCYLLELGLSDTEVGSILGMSSEMVRHYGKRARALMIARGAAERVTQGVIVPIVAAKIAGQAP
ncbi:tyrosine-type recombinase/integrase [Sphingomonas sp. IC4-52]|uniref:tyrosine-type recombinase/integrase n=1 Tax=Sphingomonas sp. IC4-52 TaxID=2887202 RepID=UPI001D0F6DFB|nr:tyrosine-type recombinase/integrase [Sphingomonas sp. IC4-52]MCC2981266.1 tyrosine-type recombinase/integrase [Sphingomonas sp. IC4-52]